jgi:hypothetical protein
VLWRRSLALAATIVAGLLVGLACLPDLTLNTNQSTCGNGVVDLRLGEACDFGDADASGCTQACQLVCEGGVIDPLTNHCYLWAPAEPNKDRAKNDCLLMGGHVVHFVSTDELQFVITRSKTLPGAPDGGGTWLALEQDIILDSGLQSYSAFSGYDLDVPGWSAQCPGCYAFVDGGDGDIPLGGAGNTASCVFWRRSVTSSWIQAQCDLGNGTQVTLCEREPAGRFSQPCDAGVCMEVRYTYHQKRYVLGGLTQGLSFSDASNTCSSIGGQLAMLKTPEEREEVAAEVAAHVPSGDVWIGLVYSDTASAWTWSDGTEVPTSFPSPWGDMEPALGSGGRGVLRMAPTLYDTRLAHTRVDGTAALPYVCELPP